VTRSKTARGAEMKSFPTKLQHDQRKWGAQNLNDIAVWKFKTFSLDARLASGDAERVSGTIAGSFEPRQSKMAIHKEEAKNYPSGAFRAPIKTPALNNVTEENDSWGPFSSQKWPAKIKLPIMRRWNLRPSKQRPQKPQEQYWDGPGIIIYKTPYHDVWSGQGLLDKDGNVGYGSVA
jgi:hypothetical protein